MTATTSSPEVATPPPRSKSHLVALIVLALIGVAFAARIRSGGFIPGDDRILRFFAGLEAFAPKVVTNVVKLTSWLGSVLFVGPLSIYLARKYIRRSRHVAYVLPIAAIGASFVHLFIKIGLPRLRPTLFAALVKAPGEGTFPSGHAVNSAAFAMAAWLAVERLAPRWSRAFGLVACVLVAWVGCTRLYLQVHWPSDVVGGFAIGAAWALLVDQIVRLIHREA